jgi:hypothetical protein
MTTRKLPKRAFAGLLGSSFSSVSDITPQAKPKNPRTELVLVHFCFDQERSESKPGRCSCALRVSKDRSYELVDAKQADFLLVPNPKTEKLTKFHRGIVVRRAVVAGETLFAMAVLVKPDRRYVKHEKIKAEIRCKARRVLQQLFAAGAISQQESQMPDVELDRALQYPEVLLANISLCRQRERWLKVSLGWWGNILGFHRLSENAGQFIEDADRGTGVVVSGGYNNAKIDLLKWAFNEVGERIRIDDGRVPVANHKASFWSGGWDYSKGTDPRIQYDGTEQENIAGSSRDEDISDE